jgi:16S rRNA C967 or C1407 C5-methylase (RsmB/RsmF family)/NOL1/NOP2/fmu family ribosome biogenesis protein
VQLPPLFRSRILKQLDSESDVFFDSFKQRVPVSVRLNPAKYIAIPQSWEAIPWHPQGYYLPHRPNFTSDPLFHAGTYYVQEASSMFLYQVLTQVTNLEHPLKVLDLCAAPGGKSTLIHSLLNDQSFLLVNEVIRSRMQPLKQNLNKWGNPNLIISNNDPADFEFLKGYFDVVVVDAPCSGEGMFRKDEKAMAEWNPEQVLVCASRQNRILDRAATLVKKGGFLVYSTCTFANEENEEQVMRLIDKGKWESILIDIQPEWGITRTTINEVIGYRFYPHKVKGEGLFMACIQKTEDDKYEEVIGKKLSYLPARQVKAVNHWLANPSQFNFVLGKEQIYAIPAFITDIYARLSNRLSIVQCGFPLGKLAGDNLIPTHELALSNTLNHSTPCVELDLSNALLYLKKGSLKPDYTWPKGWATANYLGKRLGWIKVMPNRINNYYPTEWRILKDIEI